MINICKTNISLEKIKSHDFVELVCDYCQKEFKKKKYSYLQSIKFLNKDCCSNKSCTSQKSKEVVLLKNGTLSFKRKNNNLKNFLIKSNNIHGNKYDYTKVNYIDAHTNVLIICPIHGEFLQRPSAHINNKQGCPICGLINRKNPNQKNTADFLKQAYEKWGNIYDYSLTNYIKKDKKIQYQCLKHGIVEQLPYLHLKNGCPYCNGRGINKHSKESFVIIANKIHDYKYDYSKTEFKKITDDIVIICSKHGEFTQRANNHIHLQNGCPSCAKATQSSKPEKEIFDFIKKNYDKEIITHDRKILNGKEIDIYLPDLKLGFEYHGLYFHTETIVGKKYHYEKWEVANKKGIKLIQIYENEFQKNKDLIYSKILNYLGKVKKISARKTKVVNVIKTEKELFLNKNHLQGQDSSKICYGLEYDGELVSVMTFGPSRFNKKYKYELLRFCNKTNYSIVGGASKLLNAFRKKHSGSIISYADKRYSNGNLYEKIGFKLDGHTNPSFSYVNLKNGLIYNRMKFQKQYLLNMPHYDKNLTEYKIMQLNGYDRIWDCGQYRFILI